MNSNNDISTSLCKTCKHRFRRVFIPMNPEEYKDEEGNCVLDEEENIVIMNMCIASDMDLDMDSTVECSHFHPIGDQSVPFFRHI